MHHKYFNGLYVGHLPDLPPTTTYVVCCMPYYVIHGWGQKIFEVLMQFADQQTDESWDICIYKMKSQFQACLGSRASIEKKIGANYEQLLKVFFMFLWAKKYCSICTKKLHRIKIKIILIWEELYFQIFIGCCGISNFNVSTKTLRTSLLWSHSSSFSAFINFDFTV